MNKKVLQKVFGKDIYLIGKCAQGINYWLEHPSFDCQWYWGFGYVETYTNNSRPDRARDISSHRHIDGDVLNHIVKWTMSNNEIKEFKALFERFYELKEIAGSAYRKNEELYLSLVKNDIPNVMEEILKLISPEGYNIEIEKPSYK